MPPPYELLYVCQRRAIPAHKAMVSKLIHVAKSALRLRRKNRIIVILHNGCVQLVAQAPVKVKR